MEVIKWDNSKVTLYKNVFKDLFEELDSEIKWKQERVLVMGKWREPARLTSSQGNEGLKYKYSGTIQQAEKWSETVLFIKNKVEEMTGRKYSYVLCNYYKDGKSYISYHSDSEKDLAPGEDIVSVSFGATRKFYLRHIKDGTTYKTSLGSGDVIVMSGETQKHFKHTVPKELKVKDPRINLTFRVINNQ